MKRLSNIILTLLMLTVFFTSNIFADQNRVLKVVEEVFVLEGSGSFSLENVAGNIEVNSWEKEEVKMIATKSINAWGTANPEEILDKIDIEIISQPKNLKIYTRYPLSSWPKNTRVDYQLWIPKGVSVQLESVSGTIKMEDHLNRINASTVSGNIKLNNITGNVGLKTVSGKVNASQIKGDIKATSVSGSLIFRECEGIFSDLHSTSGNIDAELIKLDKEASGMSLTTVSGEIILYIPDGSSFDLSIKTVSGEINTQFKVLVESVKKNQLVGEVGDGGMDIELKTISGDISLQKL